MLSWRDLAQSLTEGQKVPSAGRSRDHLYMSMVPDRPGLSQRSGSSDRSACIPAVRHCHTPASASGISRQEASTQLRALQRLETLFLRFRNADSSHAPYPCPGVVYIMCIGSPLYPGRKVYRDILNSILLTTSSCPISRVRLLILPQAVTAQPRDSASAKLSGLPDAQQGHVEAVQCNDLWIAMPGTQLDKRGYRTTGQSSMQVAYGFCICLPVFLSRMVASFMCGLASLIRWSHSSSVRKLPYLAYTGTFGISGVPPHTYKASVGFALRLLLCRKGWGLTRRSEGSSSGALYAATEIRLGLCICNTAYVRISNLLQGSMYWR